MILGNIPQQLLIRRIRLQEQEAESFLLSSTMYWSEIHANSGGCEGCAIEWKTVSNKIFTLYGIEVHRSIAINWMSCLIVWQ